jgi:hypothetical protein
MLKEIEIKLMQYFSFFDEIVEEDGPILQGAFDAREKERRAITRQQRD